MKHCTFDYVNAATRIISGLPRSAYISTTLANLHWLRAAERIKFILVTPAFRCLQGSAPGFLSADFIQNADVQSGRHLQPMDSFVRPSRLVTVGDRTFPFAALTCGTVFLTSSLHCSHNFLSGVNLRRFYFARQAIQS